MLWFEMLMALVAILALDLANDARPVLFRRRENAKSKESRNEQGASDGRIRSARDS